MYLFFFFFISIQFWRAIYNHDSCVTSLSGVSVEPCVPMIMIGLIGRSDQGFKCNINKPILKAG